MRAMSVPTEVDESRLIRLLRYLRGFPKMALLMKKGSGIDKIRGFVDSDFAGCRRTRRSTSGGCLLWGSSMIRWWSKTQPTIALSTGETELGAMAKGMVEGIGLSSILADFGVKAEFEVHSDATAAIGIASRQGLGKIRHVAVADLWIQECIKNGVVKVFKVAGNLNASDLLTKGLDGELMMRHLSTMGAHRRLS